MSEYQYDEFVAIDGPISDEGLRYAHGDQTRYGQSARWSKTTSVSRKILSPDAMLLLQFLGQGRLLVEAGRNRNPLFHLLFSGGLFRSLT